MNLPKEIFKAYDIRGIVGTTLTPAIVQSIGRAIGSEAARRNSGTVAIGRDGRLSGPDLASATDALTYKWKQLVRRYESSDGLAGQQTAVQEYLQTIFSARETGRVDSLRWGAALARVSRLIGIPVEDLHRRYKSGRVKPNSRSLRSTPPLTCRRVLPASSPRPSRSATTP